jgi:hypothetical protein
MQLTTVTFPVGERNVIRFNKDGFFTMVNHVALRVPDLTIFAVVEETLTNRRGIFSLMRAKGLCRLSVEISVSLSRRKSSCVVLIRPQLRCKRTEPRIR